MDEKQPPPEPSPRAAAPRPELRDSEGSVRLGRPVLGAVQLPLAGASVDQCRLDHAFTLVLDTSGRSWTLRIEGDLDLVPADGPQQRFDKGAPSTWGPVVDALLHAVVSDASVTQDGTLHLQFDDGSRIEVPPTLQWEAWQLDGPDGELIVCGPGGQLTRWPAETDTR